jgi:hypothetical protein
VKTLTEVILNGVPVCDPAARFEDLGFIFDDDAEDAPDDLLNWIWLEVDVPITLFGCNFTFDELGPLMRDPWFLNREKEREATILAWVATKGSWHEALKESPVVAVVRQGGLDFVDGWHRTKLASQSGLGKVHALIGVRESHVNSIV